MTEGNGLLIGRRMDVAIAAAGQYRREHPGAGVAEKLPPAYAEKNLVIAIALGHSIPFALVIRTCKKALFFSYGAANMAMAAFAISTQRGSVF
ncbi:hypothetical protein [Paraburkholderia phytofirmans]|uniref:Uncharacterized protein n=1 Tax=Paraburkholderia phytofirmans TaxID=261302 RepID=A0ABW9BFP5_9BURK